jgi:hypothetical protein
MLHPASADGARERNRALFGGGFGGVYSFYIERERLCRLIAALVWGADSRPFYASMRRIGEVRQGALIVDAPCGAGLAFRGLRPGQRVAHLASSQMVDGGRRGGQNDTDGSVLAAEPDKSGRPMSSSGLAAHPVMLGLPVCVLPSAPCCGGRDATPIVGHPAGTSTVVSCRELPPVIVRADGGRARSAPEFFSRLATPAVS